MRIRLWFIDETENARQYLRKNPANSSRPLDFIWIPKSVCERTTKYKGPTEEHEVDVADWWAEKHNL